MRIKIKSITMSQKILLAGNCKGYFIKINYKKPEGEMNNDRLIKCSFSLTKKTSDGNIIEIFKKEPDNLITIKEIIQYCEERLNQLVKIKKLTPNIIKNINLNLN